MRNTKVYSITMPPEMGKQAERLAKRESRTMSELMREAFRRYQIEEAQRQLLTDPLRARNLQALRETVAELRKDLGVNRAPIGLAPGVAKAFPGVTITYRQQLK